MRIVLSLVGVVVAAVALIALGAPSPIVIGLAVAGWISFISVSRQSTSQQVTVAPQTPDVTSSAELATEFSNIAFSDQLPTWKGSKHPSRPSYLSTSTCSGRWSR